MYQVELKHEGLNKYKEIKGSDWYVVEQKAQMQRKAWDEIWEKKQMIQAQKEAREQAAMEKEQKKALAIQLTNEAIEQQESLSKTLQYTLDVDDKINWEALKDISIFYKEKPVLPKVIDYPEEPREKDEKYIPKLGLIYKIFTGLKQKKLDEVKKIYETDYENC